MRGNIPLENTPKVRTENEPNYIPMFQLCPILAYEGCEYPSCQYTKEADVSSYAVQVIASAVYLSLLIVVLVQIIRTKELRSGTFLCWCTHS